MHPMQHPIHFHGQKLAVISRNGNPVDSLQWEDTVLLRTGEKIEVVLQATNVGKWLAHCHINEHAESGMKFNFEVN
jgi:FtsP/CotA-like multicopper oxidase with cupredoxin domain